MTDRPTDGHEGSSGSYSSNNIHIYYLQFRQITYIWSALWIHLIYTWLRISILGSTFENIWSGSSEPPLETFDPDPAKCSGSESATLLFYRQSLEKTFLRSQKHLILPDIVLVCFGVPRIQINTFLSGSGSGKGNRNGYRSGAGI